MADCSSTSGGFVVCRKCWKLGIANNTPHTQTYICSSSNSNSSSGGDSGSGSHTTQIYNMFPNKKDINLTAVTPLILNRFSIFFSLSDCPVNLWQSTY